MVEIYVANISSHPFSPARTSNPHVEKHSYIDDT